MKVSLYLALDQNHVITEFCPAHIDMRNKLELVNVEISTNWWRVVKNFNIVNRFSFETGFSGLEAEDPNMIPISMYWEPSVLVAITREQFMYEFKIDHNSDLFAETGIKTGITGFKIITHISRDMIRFFLLFFILGLTKTFRYHDVLINDDLTAENSFKRVTMIILAPLVTPLMPMILPDASVLQRKRRSARQADYETNFEFQFFDPEKTQKLETNQIYEIRKTQFLYKLEYDTDWPALEAVTAKHFQFW